MFAMTLMAIVVGGTAPFIGKLLNRYGANIVMAAGGALGGLGFVVLTQMHDLWQFYLGYVLVGLASSAAGALPATTVVSNWFRKRRGTAVGIMATGIGAGGLLLGPIFGNNLIPNYGWQTSYLIFAVLLFIIVPLGLLVIKSKPADKGLNPDGVPDEEITAEVKGIPLESTGLSTKQAVSTPTFWLIVVSLVLSCFSLSGVMQNQAPYLEDYGFSAATVSTVVALVGLGSLIGKFVFGWLCDRIPPKYVWTIALGFQVSAVVVIMNINSTSTEASALVYAILMGLGFGGWLPATSMLTSTNFGLTSYGVIFGLFMMAQNIGNAVGPVFAGNIFDNTGSYHQAFITFLIMFAIAVPTALAIRRPREFSDSKES
jgi:MFS family permease